MSVSPIQIPQLPEISKPAGKSAGGEFASLLESAA